MSTNIVTKKELDRLRNERPVPHQTMNYTIDDEGIKTQIHSSDETERIGKINSGDRILATAGSRLENDIAFASREGQAKAQFEVNRIDRETTDLFNQITDEPGRLEHQMMVAEDRLSEAIDQYIDEFENPAGNPTQELRDEVDLHNSHVQETERLYDASRNNGLPLDPPLDIDREEYLKSADRDQTHQLTREEYLAQDREQQPTIDRGRDR